MTSRLRSILRLFLLAIAVPAAAQTSTATAYPPECSASRLKPATIADSTRARCAFDRAHVDVVRAAAPVKTANTALAKAQATYAAAAAKLATAAAAESLARVTYGAVLHPPAPVDSTPPIVVLPPPVVMPIDSAPTVATGPATLAELPRVTPAMPPSVPMRQVRVCATCSLQAALNAAQSGDELLVQPDATYVGNFTLPNKGPGQSWIVIRTDATLSTTGRMTPTQAAALRLAKILSPNYGPAIGTDPGAHHYRLTGLEIGTTPAAEASGMNVLVRFGDAVSNGQRTLAAVPHDLILDRSFVHGTATLNLKRCATVNSASTIIIDSWLGDCHDHGSDSQAILGYNGTSGILILNNHLEAGHEIVAFGGNDPADSSTSPADITIRGNYIARPLAWKGRWQAKNILETKNARRMLIEGNVFENAWKDAQEGFAFVLKSENQGNTAPWSQSADITIRRNVIRCVANGFNLSGKGSSTNPNIRAARFTITDNLIELVNTPPCTGDGNVLQLLSGIEDIVFAHNTIVNPRGTNNLVVLGDPLSATRFAMHSNVAYPGQYGVKAGGFSAGSASITGTLPGSLFGANLLIGAQCSSYPPTTQCPSSLPSTLPAGIDGRPAGADLAAIARTTANAVVAP